MKAWSWIAHLWWAWLLVVIFSGLACTLVMLTHGKEPFPCRRTAGRTVSVFSRVALGGLIVGATGVIASVLYGVMRLFR